jgi:hypothetical protein
VVVWSESLIESCGVGFDGVGYVMMMMLLLLMRMGMRMKEDIPELTIQKNYIHRHHLPPSGEHCAKPRAAPFRARQQGHENSEA